jgi:uncharacterized protein YukE
MTTNLKNLTIVNNAKLRASGMKSIAPALDMGGGMSIKAYQSAIQDAEAKIEAYNTAIANISQMRSAADAAEKSLSQLSERMLSTVAGHYGRSSDQYAMAGGTKRTSRRRTVKKKPEAGATLAVSAKQSG